MNDAEQASGFSHQISDRAKFTFDQAVTQYVMTKLTVTNMERSLKYYTEVIGLKEIGRLETSEVREILLTRTGQPSEFTLVLFNKKNGENKIGTNGLSDITFLLPDVRAIAKKVTDAGYDTLSAPVDLESPFSYATTVTFAFVKDPDGYVVELAQLHK